VYKFRDYLHQQGYIVTIRSTRGDDIDAACGQLVGNVEDRTKRSARYIKMNDITNAADTTQS
jgi:23S rRNA (adenine2503-C2)-methyltransferase